MRVLIYSESEAAKAKCDELRAQQHHASLRNPQYFNPAQFDKNCELVIADDANICEAYAAAGIDAQLLTTPKPVPQAERVEIITETEDEPVVKPRARAHKRK